VDDLFETYDALAVGRLVRTGRLGARELLDATLARLRALNESLNAITDLYEGDLLEQSVARAGDGPFRGVPFLVKQLMADCAGTPTTVGSRFFAKEPVAAADSAAVVRMRRAGLVIVGRTNTSEFGLAPTTEPAEVEFGPFRLNLATRSLTRDGEPIPLTTGEFSVLKVLCQNPRVPMSREKLMALARGREYGAYDRSLDVQISRLRKLVETDPQQPRYIQTVWGVGYVFIPDDK